MQKCVTSPTNMEQLGRLVQLQLLHTFPSRCHHEGYKDDSEVVSYNALSNLQSFHTLECDENHFHSSIPKKNLRILKGSIINALLTSDYPVQLKELWLSWYGGDYSLLWNYLARAESEGDLPDTFICCCVIHWHQTVKLPTPPLFSPRAFKNTLSVYPCRFCS